MNEAPECGYCGSKMEAISIRFRGSQKSILYCCDNCMEFDEREVEE